MAGSSLAVSPSAAGWDLAAAPKREKLREEAAASGEGEWELGSDEGKGGLGIGLGLCWLSVSHLCPKRIETGIRFNQQLF